MIAIPALPPVVIGPNAIRHCPEVLAAMGPPGPVALLADPFWQDRPETAALDAALTDTGWITRLLVPAPGEPTADDIARMAKAAQDCGAVVALGGGSVLDSAKMVAFCAASGTDPMAHALGAQALPTDGVPLIAIPTTAGTGSEANATAVFSGPDGTKLWAFGPALLPRQVILDPDLLTSLPPHLTAWCALDAFVHAFEAATNAHTHPIAQRYATWALAEIPAALLGALSGNPDALARLQLAAFHAGFAIGQSGTAIAHCLSHALAGCVPVHHGLATALAFRASLPWLLRQPAERLAPVTAALNLASAAELPAYVEDLFAAAGLPNALPETCAGVTPEALLAHMGRPECAPMAAATLPRPDPEDLRHLAALFLGQTAATAQAADARH